MNKHYATPTRRMLEFTCIIGPCRWKLREPSAPVRVQESCHGRHTTSIYQTVQVSAQLDSATHIIADSGQT